MKLQKIVVTVALVVMALGGMGGLMLVGYTILLHTS